jgi:hypothetical protein
LAIGEHLGFRVRECDREDYFARNDRPEIEFLSTGTGGDLVMLSSVEDLLERRIVLTGDHGDTAWDKDSPRVSREIKRGDPGSALADFRGRVGFQILPVPFIGIVNHPELHSISNSADMRRWSLARNRYDRPIARRIAEEQGIAREAFGQNKRAIAQTFHPTTEGHEALETMLSPPALRDFRAFYAALPRSVIVRSWSIAAVMHRAFWLNQWLARCIRRLARTIGVDIEVPLVVPARYRLAPQPNDFTFHWAIGEMITRYRRMLGANRSMADGGGAHGWVGRQCSLTRPPGD